MKRVCVVVPVFNDWISFSILLDRLNWVSKTLGLSVLVVAVNDGSTEPEPDWTQQAPAWRFLDEIHLVELAANLGHQRAIAVGLCVAVEDHPWDAVIIMDADGEDPPEQISTLLQKTEGRTDFSIVAQRRKRTESLTFRFSYLIYKTVFKILTGKKIGFGNFSLISRKSARRLTMIPDLWNNLAAALLRSRLPLDLVPIDRGRRYAGSSKMNYVSLITHGLSGISVYADTIYARLLVLSVFLVAFTAIVVPTLLTIRVLSPTHATPGWATTVTFGLIMILFQVFLTTVSSILLLLNGRVQRVMLPLLDYKQYIDSIRRIR